MNTQKLIQGFAALMLVSLPVAGIGCVGQADSESEEAIAEAEQAVSPTAACPQGPGTVLVATGAADGGFSANYDNDCGSTAIVRLLQYTINANAATDLAIQCRNHCTDNGRFPACGVGYRLDAATAADLGGFFTPHDTSNLTILQERPLLGQSLSGSQEVTCIDRVDVDAAGDDQRQWVAICTCSNLQ